MKTKKREGPRVPAYAIVPLSSEDVPRLLHHFLALDEADRALRFGVASDDDAVRRYVTGIDFAHSAVLAASAPDGTLDGVAHLALSDDVAEIGLSIAGHARGRGLGRALSVAALSAARRRGAREFRLHCAANNAGMRRLVEILGMQVTADGSDLIARLSLRAPRSTGATQSEAVAIAE